MNKLIFSEISSSPDDTSNLVIKKIIPELNPFDKVFLVGEVGVGKTFITKCLLSSLGVKEEVNSPTFTLIREYSLLASEVGDRKLGRLGKLDKISHLDLYRLESGNNAALIDLDLLDKLDRKELILIEWGEKFPHLKKFATKEIKIQILGEAKRKIVFSNLSV